ncbi:MAG: hypothetical protein ACLFVU_00715 [Phycisphaerae bacterium]
MVSHGKCHSGLIWVCVAFVAGVLAPVAAGFAAEDAPFTDAELRVRIGNYWTMRLTAQDGKWEPVTRARPSFKHVDFGYVTASKGTPAGFSVSMQLRDDGGVRSNGYVFYEMQFKRAKDGSYTGTFKETRGSRTETGTIAAFLLPDQPADAVKREPIASGEYPRLLLRKGDVPALREKAKTPLGKAFIEKAKNSKDPVLLGTLYQATGLERYALEALRIVQGYSDIDGNAALSGNVGHQIVSVVLTADLCYDAWPEEYRDDLLQQIKARMPKRQYDLTIAHANYNHVSNYYGPGFGSAAIATLLLHKSKGPAPDEPVKPLCVRFKDCKVPPVENYSPPQSVPVVPLTSDELPADWIYAGPLKPAENAEPLKSMGGPEKARPTVGDDLSDGNQTVRFEPVSKEKDKGYYVWGDRKVLDVSNAIGRVYHSTSYYYTVIKNDTPGWYQFRIGQDHKESRTWLNGFEIREGDVMQLDKGLYTVLIRVDIGQTEPWGREMLAARFAYLPDKKVRKQTVEEINAEIRARYDQALAFWKTETAEWKARDGEDLQCLRMFHKGREQMYQHLRFGIGDGGFQAEVTHYGNIAAHYPLLYATCFRKAMGRDVSPYPDATHVLPRQMMQAYIKDDRPVIMDLNVKGHFDTRWLALNFPMVPKEYKPHLLWSWDRLMGAERNTAGSPDAATAETMLQSVNGQTLAAAFVNYPLDIKPVHPSKGMPLTWAADTLGFYVFRSGWQGKDEFIAQVFSKSIPIRAWSHPNAGAFRLWGLGHRWTAAPIERSGYRPEESIVHMPDDVIYKSTCGKIDHHTARADGSGSLSIDMTDVYLAVKPPEQKSDFDQMTDSLEDLVNSGGPSEEMKIDNPVKTPEAATDYFRQKDRSKLRRKLPKLYNGYAERREVDYSSHVDGDRAFAFDYSGKSGAPCLMVMVDHVRGGERKQWLWHLPDAEEIKAEAKKNAFTLSYPDANLKGTFVSPAKIQPQFMEDKKMYFIYRGGSLKGKSIERSYDFIAAETDSEETLYFVVVTVQRGKAPAVTTTGNGKDTVVTVGGRRISYHDGRIVIEDTK